MMSERDDDGGASLELAETFEVIFYCTQKGCGFVQLQPSSSNTTESTTATSGEKNSKSAIFFHATRNRGRHVPETGDRIRGKPAENEKGKFLEAWSGGSIPRRSGEGAGALQRKLGQLEYENRKLELQGKQLAETVHRLEERVNKCEKETKKIPELENTVGTLTTNVNACRELFDKVDNVADSVKELRNKFEIIVPKLRETDDENGEDNREEQRRKRPRQEEHAGTASGSTSGPLALEDAKKPNPEPGSNSSGQKAPPPARGRTRSSKAGGKNAKGGGDMQVDSVEEKPPK